MLYYRLRLLLTIIVVLGIAGGIIYFVSLRDYEANVARFQLQVTAAVATAVQEALYTVTRTAEAPGNRFQVVRLGQNEDLAQLARHNGTTLEILQIVNGLAPDVTTGSGETIIVPVGIQVLKPPRTITVYSAQPGDTLASIAERNIVPLEMLEQDNPVLAQRGLTPGDIVFIGFEL